MDYFEAFQRGLYAFVQCVGFGAGALILLAIVGAVAVAVQGFVQRGGEEE